MNASAFRPRYSLGEEIANSVTHGVGVLLAIAGLAVLKGYPFSSSGYTLLVTSR
jgi:predicted membrane channel-forming protein YqfA (hemolysin III family)